MLRAPHHRARQDGTTGLILASMNGHVEVVRLLLDSKADANLADEVQPHHAPFPAGRRACPGPPGALAGGGGRGSAMSTLPPSSAAGPVEGPSPRLRTGCPSRY